MTTVATMMAAVPSALGLGAGHRDARADGRSRCSAGSSVSTVLSLLVVPAFYVVADRIASRLKKDEAPLAEPLSPMPSPPEA